MRRVAGFALTSVPGVDQPRVYGPVKPSPDRRHLLMYWKKSYRKGKPDLVVIDRTGVVVESGSQLAYDRFAHRNAVAWLPDVMVIDSGPKRRAQSAPLRGARVSRAEMVRPNPRT